MTLFRKRRKLQTEHAKVFYLYKTLKQYKVITSVGCQGSDYSSDGVRAGARGFLQSWKVLCLHLGTGYMDRSLCKSISHLSLFTLLNIFVIKYVH